MATEEGQVTDDLIRLHTTLVRGGVGLTILGHAFVHQGGRATRRQLALDRDEVIPSLERLTSAVHETGGRIFAQINHAGSQSAISDIKPVGPSAVQNPIFDRVPRPLTGGEVREAVGWFADAARRVKQCGFDGVHVHAANGYLISEFCSPHTNTREDEWGGSAERRTRFLAEIISEVRREVGREFPVTVKLGMADTISNGLTIEEGCVRAKRLEELGVNAIEVSCGIMRSYKDSAGKYVAVHSRRALSDLLFHRIFREPLGQAYFLPYAERLRDFVKIPLILVGGIRSTDLMERVIETGKADFIAMARPFIREPNIVSKIAEGRTGLVDCTSCNLCLEREGVYELKCWRRRRIDLLGVFLRRLLGRK